MPETRIGLYYCFTHPDVPSPSANGQIRSAATEVFRGNVTVVR
ncbi:MAG: hypothetical protein ACKVU2_02370 [Saprospiraceae bacterium]